MAKVLTCLLLAVVALNGACVRTGELASSKQTANTPFSELSVKLELQQALKETTDQKTFAIAPHRLVKNGQGAGFVLPAGMSYSDSGGLYISDNNGHRIHYWPVDSSTAESLTPQSGKGKLKFPNSILCANEKVFVSDNDGIKVFSAGGQFERLIRPYYGIFSFTKTTKDTIFANTLIRNSQPQDPLIVELDHNGREIRGFGLRRNVAGHNGLEEEAFLALSQNVLLAAFKYRPSVELYDIDSGKMIGSFDIDHPVFRSLATELERRGVSDKQEKGRIFLPRYLAGIRVLGSRVFICLALPEPEIWEVDQIGNRLARFQVSGLPHAVDVFGFDVRSVGSNLLFSVGIIDQGWNTTVSELRINSNEKGDH